MGVFIVLALVGLTAAAFGFMDYLDERKFLANSAETTGKIVGAVGAKYTVRTDAAVPYGGATAAAMTMLNRRTTTQELSAGTMVIVEYEDGEGNVYQTRSCQVFKKVESDAVTVNYDPESPGTAVINGFYSGKAKYYQMIGGVLFAILPPLAFILFS